MRLLMENSFADTGVMEGEYVTSKSWSLVSVDSSRQCVILINFVGIQIMMEIFVSTIFMAKLFSSTVA